jgi:hypothetical protein
MVKNSDDQEGEHPDEREQEIGNVVHEGVASFQKPGFFDVKEIVVPVFGIQESFIASKESVEGASIYSPAGARRHRETEIKYG